jgi:hypothetical protein
MRDKARFTSRSDASLTPVMESWKRGVAVVRRLLRSLRERVIVDGRAETTQRLSWRREPFEYVEHEAGGLQQCELRSVAGYKKPFTEQGVAVRYPRCSFTYD